MAGEVRYEAEITGHRAPFRWRVLRSIDAAKRVGLATKFSGKADTFEEACFQAAEAARDAEDERAHESTREFVPLFEVPQQVVREDETDLPVAKPVRPVPQPEFTD